MADAELGTSQQPERLTNLHDRFQTAQKAADLAREYRESIDTISNGNLFPQTSTQDWGTKFFVARQNLMAKRGISKEAADALVLQQIALNELSLKVTALTVEQEYLPAQIQYIETTDPSIIPLTNAQILDLPDPKAKPPQPPSPDVFAIIKAYAKRHNMRPSEVLAQLHAMMKNIEDDVDYYNDSIDFLDTYNNALSHGERIYQNDYQRARDRSQFVSEYKADRDQRRLYGHAIVRVEEIPAELQATKAQLQSAQQTYTTLEAKLTQQS